MIARVKYTYALQGQPHLGGWQICTLKQGLIKWRTPIQGSSSIKSQVLVLFSLRDQPLFDQYFCANSALGMLLSFLLEITTNISQTTRLSYPACHHSSASSSLPLSC